MEIVEVPKVKQTPHKVQSTFESKLRNEHLVDYDKLQAAVSILPSNYTFEVEKTLCRILDIRKQQSLQNPAQAKMSKVSLQFPEGLLVFSTLIADIIKKFGDVDCLILGDVTYGACCVDDLASKALDCDFIVHYGHSCLVPIQELVIKNALYVFVEIDIDIDHLTQSILFNFSATPQEPLYILGTVQFNKALYVLKSLLEKHTEVFPPGRIQIPQTKPRSGGEVLGCTSPVIGSSGSVIFISDGRFHIESAMIKNPKLQFYQYNPYSMKLTEEAYEHEAMHEVRFSEIKRAREAKMWGIVFGTLGRQGNQGLLKEIEGLLRQHGKPYFILFLSELSPAKLNRFPKVEAWVQIACPRLSVDWGHTSGFKAPLLNTYETFVCLGEAKWLGDDGIYPMDYYSYDGGRWSNYFRENEDRKKRLAERAAAKKAKAEVKIEYDQTPDDGQL